MKLFISILLSFFFFCNSFSQNSNIYGVTNFTSTGLCLSKVNPVTGSVTQVSSSQIANSITGNALSTVDPINNKYYFVSAGNLITIDLNSGLVLNSAPLNYAVNYIRFNSSDTTIYCLSNLTPSVSAVFLAKINPQSGIVSFVSSSSLSSSINGSAGSTIDPVNKKYYFVSANNIFSIDLFTGVASNIAPLSKVINQIVFNCEDATIYCLSNPTSGTVSAIALSKVNPITGSVTVISSSSVASYINGNAYSAIDFQNQNYCFVSLNDIISLNLQTGAVSYSSILSNVINLMASSSTCQIETSINSYSNFKDDIAIFPNPSQNEVNIVVNNRKNKTIEMKLFDSIGNLLKSEIENTKDNVTISKGNLSNGFYYLSVYLDNVQIKSLKIVFE